MINLYVDEGYAFDFLSILQIKKNKSIQSMKNWQDCFDHLKSQLPNDLFNSIIYSQEYSCMIEINQKTFDAVEKARYGEITAKEVDNANMERYHVKNKLQNKFFNNKPTEEKT
jgi:hypothetical protein